VLTFFIAGLLFICASSTSITWERTASRPETGLLIPSVYDSDMGSGKLADWVREAYNVLLVFPLLITGITHGFQ